MQTFDTKYINIKYTRIDVMVDVLGVLMAQLLWILVHNYLGISHQCVFYEAQLMLTSCPAIYVERSSSYLEW